MNKLSKKTIINVPWNKFNIVDGGIILNRYLVEAYVEIPSNISNILFIIPYEAYGYAEYAVINGSYKYFRCGQILTSDFHNNNEGNMKILIIHM